MGAFYDNLTLNCYMLTFKKKNQHFNKMKIPNALDVITFPSTVNAKKSVRELVEFPFSFPDTGVTD